MTTDGLRSSILAGVLGAGETHHGGRQTNQDVFVVNENLGLFAVLDGMGGAAAGDIAAQIASDALVNFIRAHLLEVRDSPVELLERAIGDAGAAVHRAAKQEPRWQGMGTTVVACLVIDASRAVIGHAGDSRAYLFRGGHLQELTRDHTIAQELVLERRLTAAEAAQSGFNHILTRNLGDEDGVHADTVELALKAGDRILLCSDGLHGCVPHEQLEHVLSYGKHPRHAAEALIKAALKTGAVRDNVSAVVVDVGCP